ncbi:hypothetical protein RUM43_014564 [Polyplax serrata]|uniref:Ankyrin repeat domain-containing protein 49 n=1 Tax=Polyplax serrata TaxID=468196 RepID=A0AAN8P116_POLSC
MSSDEDDRNHFSEEQIKEIKRISKLKKKYYNDRFQVSGWDDDTEGIVEEKEPHAKPVSEILWAAENGDLDLVKKLLSQDPELVNVKDSDGYTPLHRACYNDHSDVTEYLLSTGGDIFAKTIDLWQPLHSACRWNNAVSAAKLLEAGADINCKSKGGQTPLHLAASNGNAKETLQLLLCNTSLQPNLKNDNNETALDIAQRHGKYYKLFEIVNPNINQLS